MPFLKTSPSSSKSSKKKGKGNKKGSSPNNYGLPDCISVKKGDRNWQRLNFSNDSALALEIDSSGNGYDYYINDDNIVMKNAMALPNNDAEVVESLFRTSLILYGMSLAAKHSAGCYKNLQNFDLTEFSMQATEAYSVIAIPSTTKLASAHEDL